MKDLELTREEQRAVRKYTIKKKSGIATQQDEDESVYAVMNALFRHAVDEEVIREREEMFKNLWKEVAAMFPEDEPLSDVPYFAIGQLGQFCRTLLANFMIKINPDEFEKFEKVEGLLEHCITEYLGDYNATVNKITEVTMEEAIAAKTDESRLRIKQIVLNYLDDAYRQKDKDTLFMIFILLNFSDKG